MTQSAPLKTFNARSKESASARLLLQRKCACGSNASALTGECDECREKELTGRQSPSIQPKLKISQPNDPYEQEADRVADHVMRMPESTVQRAAATGKQDEEVEEDNGLVQRKTTGHSPPSSPSVPNHFFLSNLGPGQPLDTGTRSFFEPRFGHDLSEVRVHTDNSAAESAHSIQARAYTLGRDIVFGAGQYTPETTHGQRLLAHELTHTIQQTMEGTRASLEVVFRAEATDSVPPENDIDFEVFITASEDPYGGSSFLTKVHKGVADLTSALLVFGDVFVVGATDSAGNELLSKGKLSLPPELEEVADFAGNGIQLRVIGNLREKETERIVEASFTPALGGNQIRMRFRINALPEQPDALNPDLAKNERERFELRRERARKRRAGTRRERSALRERAHQLRKERRQLHKQIRQLDKAIRQKQQIESCDFETQKMVDQALGLAVHTVDSAIMKLQSNDLPNQAVRKALHEFMGWPPGSSEPSTEKKRIVRIIDALILARNNMLLATHSSIRCAIRGNEVCDPQTGAYVSGNVRGATVSICPVWVDGQKFSFKVAPGPGEARAYALLHEFIHLSGPHAQEQEKFYVDNPEWKTLSAEQALGFADGYAALAWSLSKSARDEKGQGKRKG